MYQFDKTIIRFIIDHFPHSKSLYEVIFFLSNNNLLKGGVLVLILWYLWFKNSHSLITRRVLIINTLLSSFAAILVSRMITFLTPFRPRPFLDPEFTYFNFDIDYGNIDTLSSFPSDHAVLFISLATGLFYVSRKAGLFALFYALTFICFPRIYLGYHYPSDIITGALIGSTISTLFNKSKFINNQILSKAIPYTKNYQHWFYLLFFLLSYEIISLYREARSLLSLLKHFI